MKSLLALAVCTMLLISASAQKKPAGTETSAAKSSIGTALEAKVRKAWKDYQVRDKESFAAILAPGFSEVTDGSEGAIGRDQELAEIDHFKLAHYELSNFKVRPLGSAALVTYSAKYDGSYDNSPLNMNTLYGEVWVKSGADWKVLWVQETKLK